VNWYDIPPVDAVEIVLPRDDIEPGPFNEMGEQCPWPWDPQQLVGAPLGQYHCPYCGGMQVAGLSHLDWGPDGMDAMEIPTCSKCGNGPLGEAEEAVGLCSECQ
jgi:hypothetical protein